MICRLTISLVCDSSSFVAPVDGPNPGGPPPPPTIGQNPPPPSSAPTCAQACIEAVRDNCISNTPGDNGEDIFCDVLADSDGSDGEGEGREGDRLLRTRIQDLSMMEDDILSKSVAHQLEFHEKMINLLNQLLAEVFE